MGDCTLGFEDQKQVAIVWCHVTVENRGGPSRMGGTGQVPVMLTSPLQSL